VAMGITIVIVNQHKLGYNMITTIYITPLTMVTHTELLSPLSPLAPQVVVSLRAYNSGSSWWHSEASHPPGSKLS
jgi:hypothetical protein